MATINHKQGDTLDWVITLTEGGTAVDITSWTIRAQIRAGDTLIASLTVTLVNAASGLFRLSATAGQTDSWSAGSHSCDVEFTDDNSIVFSTETFTVSILEDISHD
jgi:hypothetical protein